ncbi:RNA polymerase subunit sigma-70 [Lewinellaceae bacterium SD302]|nr:RNA polymerase subunit sigma-70 [Lewinellaceae bacterium SD302]
MPEINDQDLISSMARGDTQAMKALYARHADRVYNTALVYLQVPNDAEEVAQDVFTKAWRSAAKFKGNSQVSTWLYRITVNTALSKLKKRKRKSFLGLGELTKEPTNFSHPETKLEFAEEQQTLYAAIYGLPARQKTAFVLSYIENLPRQQVADVMAISLKAVESLLIRSKKSLRVSLADYKQTT